MRELTSWNEKTHNEVIEFFKKSNSAAIINATGIGKTSIIAKIIKEYVNLGKIMVVAPRESILNQYNKVEYDIFDYQNITMISYQMLSSLYKKKDFDLAGYSLIVFDELHRTGAKTWGAAILGLKELNPDAKFLGATATPRRYDQKDQIEDMVDILFEGNRAGNYDLVECLKNDILPLPTYVSTLYSMKEELALRNDTVNTIKDEEVKKNMLFALREVEINWEKSHSVAKTLNTFLGCLLTSERNIKILVFCKNKQHIREIKDVFDPIFKKIFKSATDISIGKYFLLNLFGKLRISPHLLQTMVRPLLVKTKMKTLRGALGRGLSSVLLEEHSGVGGLYFVTTNMICAFILTITLQLSWTSQVVAMADNFAYITSLNTAAYSYVGGEPLHTRTGS